MFDSNKLINFIRRENKYINLFTLFCFEFAVLIQETGVDWHLLNYLYEKMQQTYPPSYYPIRISIS